MKRFILIFAFFLSVTLTADVMAQCSVCRNAAESNIEGNENKRGRGLNRGILYLMSVPYLMGGVAGIIWWKHRKK